MPVLPCSKNDKNSAASCCHPSNFQQGIQRANRAEACRVKQPLFLMVIGAVTKQRPQLSTCVIITQRSYQRLQK